MISSYSTELSAPQSAFFFSRAPYVAAIAGFGSGKTYTLWMKLWHWLCEHPGTQHGYFAPTQSLIRDILFPMASEWCEAAGVGCTITYKPQTIHIHGMGKIVCFSMSRPEMIVGFEIGNAAVDEIDILPKKKAWSAWRKIKARCRVKLYDSAGVEMQNQMAIASTPEGFKMAYEAFKKDPLPGSQLIQMSTYSNAHNLPKNYIPDLKATYPGPLFDSYALGKFTNLTSGTVYTSFSRSFNGCKNIKLGNREPLYIGMDFNVRKMAAIVHVKRPPFVVAANELLGLRDTPTMIDTIKRLYTDHPITIYPDASGAHPDSRSASRSDISMLRAAGFGIKTRKKNPFVKDRIISMNTAFAGTNGYKYVVDIDGCKSYIDTLEQQAYDEQGEPDKDNDLDHPPDAAGYFINMDYGIIKPKAGTVRTTGT